MTRTKVTTESLRRMKAEGRKIACLTAYDCLFAELLDAAGVDVLLVGDSVATVVQGEDSTVPVTMEQMIYHCSMVARGTKRALVVGDLPFLSYQLGPEEALRNAGALMKQSRVEAVKLEGGRPVLTQVRCLVDAGIPVVGHLGLTPQSIHQFGTYRVRGTDDDEAEQLIEDAIELERAGACALVLEKIPATLAAQVTGKLEIPTIGIGAGPQCDGQILVSHDLLGLFDRFRPRFVRRYADLSKDVRGAVERYCSDVQTGEFPHDDESY